MNLPTLLAQMERTQWEKRAVPRLKGPILTRMQLQQMRPPKADFVTRTSGCTGIPVEVQRTHLSQLWTAATNLREVIWHKRDIKESFASIRPQIQAPVRLDSWGPAFELLGKTGPSYGHPVRGDLNAWLQKIQPGYLTTYPSILQTIDLDKLTNLKGIKTTGETLNFSHPLIADMYSCEEVGTIAIQCPDNSAVYHVMEHLLVEILDENNEPADQGKVVVTDLTSTYLHRYEIGDHAAFGSCHCGRGLQTIKKILGRTRNRVVLPDGSKHWPLVGSLKYRDIAPIRRFQVAQIGKTVLELRLVSDRLLTATECTALTELIQQSIGYPFDIEFKYVEGFDSHKFEEFVNLYLVF